MAKIKIQGNASGTGTLTLTAPNTNADRTITLPDEDITLGGGVDGIVSTANATAITIDSSENVGVGKVPETWDANWVALEVGQRTTLASYTGGGGATLFKHNAYGGFTSKYQETAGATGMYMDDENIKFEYATSGTADTAITWVTSLQLKNDGRGLSQFTAFAWANIGLDNVAAGNTSPDGSHNISSVTLVSTGTARFNFTNSASTASVSSLVTNNTAGGTAICNGTTTTYNGVQTYNSSGGSVNASLVNVVTFGGN